MVKNLMQDVTKGKLHSAYTIGRFDNSKSMLESNGYSVSSLEELAGLRIQEGIDAPVSTIGARTREAIVYVPKKGIFLTKKSPIMANPDKISYICFDNKFYLTNEEIEFSLEDALRIDNIKPRCVNVLTSDFGNHPLTSYVFGRNAKAYAEFLKEKYIWEIEFGVTNMEDKPFANLIHFNSIKMGTFNCQNTSSINDHYCEIFTTVRSREPVRGVRAPDKSDEDTSKKEILPKFNVKQRRTTITVPHCGKNISFAVPYFSSSGQQAICSCSGQQAIEKQIENEGLLKPTFAETVSLLYSAVQNKHNKYAQQIVDIVSENGILCFNKISYQRNLSKEGYGYLPEGIFISDRNLKETYVSLNWRRAGVINLDNLEQNIMIRALAEDKECLEKLAKIADITQGMDVYKHYDKANMNLSEFDIGYHVKQTAFPILQLSRGWLEVKIENDYRKAVAFGLVKS
jgi:hypothetical protein